MKVCSDCLRCYDEAISACAKENHRPLVEVRPGNCEIAGNYLLEYLIKIDEIGETYRAVNSVTSERFVITVIAEKLIDNVARFQTEVRRAAEINHSNIARIYESGSTVNGDFYIVSEPLDGQLLSERLKSGERLLEISAVDIARQTAEALESLHAAGIIHRNINAENIVLAAGAENGLLVKVQNIDFSGVRQRFVVSGAANSETVINSLKYFSPEQCAKESVVSFSTDIYSLGIVLYEMLTGQTPFTAWSAAEIIEKQISEMPPPVRIANFDIRALLTHTLTLSLQKAVSARLKSANVFARQLRHIEQYAARSFSPAVSERILVNEKLKIQSGNQIAQPAAAPFEIFSPNETILAHLVKDKNLAIAMPEEVLTEPEATAIDEPKNTGLFTEKADSSTSETAAASTAEVKAAEISPVNLTEAPAPETNMISLIEPEKFSEEVSAGTPEIFEPLPFTKPALIEWEQPEDIPTVAEAEKISKRAFGKKSLVEAVEIDEPKKESNFENLTAADDSAAIDEDFDEDFDEENSSDWSVANQLLSVPNNRLFIGGSAFLMLLIVAGVFWAWHSSPIKKQTVAGSMPAAQTNQGESSKNITAPAEKSEETAPSNDETASIEMPDLPDSRTFTVRESQPSTERSFPAVAKSAVQNVTPKESINVVKTNLKKEAPNLKNKSADKMTAAQNAFPDVKIIIPNRASNSDPAKSKTLDRPAKHDTFSRPRIVDKKGNLRVF